MRRNRPREAVSYRRGCGGAGYRLIPTRGGARRESRSSGPRSQEAIVSAESLTVVDNRTGAEYTLPIVDGAIHATDFGKIKGAGRRRPAVVRPRVPEHRVVPEHDHLHRRRRRDPALPRLPDRAGRRAGRVPRDRLPAARGRAADRGAAAALDGRRAQPHLRAHEHRGVHGRLPLRRASDGDAARRGRRALDLLPGREEHPRPAEPLHPARAADREAADDRGVHLPPLPRPAVRAAAQRPRLHRQLRQHDVRDRRPARAEPGAAARARDPAHPPRRPRAELLDERRAQRRLVERRPVLGRLGRDRGALRAAARRRQRGRAADARRDRRRRRTCPRSSRRSRTAAQARA